MSFLVNFRSAEGKPGYHPADTLEEAIRFVEHLRNQEQVTDARVWRLQEVPLEVKTYYKVVVPSGSAAAPVAAPVPDPVVAAAPPDLVGPKVEAAAGGSDSAGANGRFGRFNRT